MPKTKTGKLTTGKLPAGKLGGVDLKGETPPILEALVDLYWVLDREGRLLRTQNTKQGLQAFSDTKWEGKAIRDIFPALQANIILTTISQTNATGENHYVEYPMEMDGETCWFGATAIPMGSGQVLWAARDITQQRKDEAGLRFRLDFENILIALFQNFLKLPIENTDKEIERALHLVGAFLQVEYGSVFIFDNQYNNMQEKYLWARSSSAEDTRVRMTLRCDWYPWLMQRISDGTIAQLTLKDLPKNLGQEGDFLKERGVQGAVFIPMSSGNILRGFLMYGTKNESMLWTEDILALLNVLADLFNNALEHRNADTRLRRSEARTMALISAIPDMMFRLNRKGELLDFTGGDEQELFLTDEYVGKSLSTVLPEPIFNQYKAFILSTLEQKTVQTLEYEQELPRGKQHYEARFVVSAHDEVLAIVRNNSEKVRLEQMKSDFVNRATHELRTPLTTALLMVNLMDGKASDDEKKEYWRVLRNELQRQQSLVEDLLTVGRLERQSFVITRKPVDILEVLDEVMSGLSHVAESKGVDLTIDRPREFPLVMGDAKGLQQVLINLIGNAIKFTPERGMVSIRLGLEQTDAFVVVQDNGIGIPAEDLPNLFTRFFRAGNAVASAIPGTGIGLYIVKVMVEGMGGAIKVESNLNKGTKFTLQLNAKVPTGELKSSSYDN